ncbi:Uncharacterized conserved protein YdhG, YjbR/CyaY-like superfamily, DUF1801 family [Pedococcus dokdonensis]|uniref:Uncharacterized conserved protein YdhG, YjbR/CyaY-like superfamily, DUF1801 family n=1 Tax=Pedococcus dokdonensis TaxID=443156 RepID=A0A1H0LYH1_9MICO|nr:hypothetical protein [Pedococcus dokdonensis]SDO73197.1 Uncharacterized conserved protein YdhG, YjbR/CyaY-like superfamily, DUF1801 family [Pedococcus dokdonensis]
MPTTAKKTTAKTRAKTTATRATATKATAAKAAAKTAGSKSAFTADERAAMRERNKEAKGAGSAQDLLDKIAEMPPEDRVLAERIHQLVTEAAPALQPSTWYGMPAWKRDGKAVVFFKPASKFKARYATFEFNDSAMLDDGTMWPIGYAVTALTPALEKQITALVTKAAG